MLGGKCLPCDLYPGRVSCAGALLASRLSQELSRKSFELFGFSNMVPRRVTSQEMVYSYKHPCANSNLPWASLALLAGSGGLALLRGAGTEEILGWHSADQPSPLFCCCWEEACAITPAYVNVCLTQQV